MPKRETTRFGPWLTRPSPSRIGAAAALALALVLFDDGYASLALVLFLLGLLLWLGGGSETLDEGGRTRAASLAMHLDPCTGEMEGIVLRGPFKGQSLSHLTWAQLDLFQAFLQGSGDEASLALLLPYLDERRASLPVSGRAMGIAEAHRILGLAPGASAAEITAAYTRLLRHANPATPEPNGYALLLTAARDLLLGR